MSFHESLHPDPNADLHAELRKSAEHVESLLAEQGIEREVLEVTAYRALQAVRDGHIALTELRRYLDAVGDAAYALQQGQY